MFNMVNAAMWWGNCLGSRSRSGASFHDLRHSYATWLVSDGVPVNDVQSVVGREQATTMLNLFTHTSGEAANRIRGTFDAFSLPQPRKERKAKKTAPKNRPLTCDDAGGPDGT
ncbi:tyrosine-type recombinase/integrase [Phytoactinopolyspora limicola]|uniref:tyrosine-type recombinase/integrase n=1 Tax=Phytoactinopolyspora limicola TaxID=2715536 RepID=UPI001A9C329D|nr:tyrosine-type recombinase/integrase [Phytoactinopolyspora limicola]